jgi:predicted ArsR family transcriptional regulator
MDTPSRTEAAVPALLPGDAELLGVLRRAGPMTAEALAAVVAMSRTSVLRRLVSLGDAGLVGRRAARRGGVGRPHYQYDVTPDAHGRLDTRYGALAGSLVDAVVDVGGGELLARVLDARRRRATRTIRRRFRDRGVDGAPLMARVRELASWEDEQGFAADVVELHGLRLRHHDCPILRIASASPAACDAELRLIADVLEADVERESLIAAGARRCIYRIEPRVRRFRGPTWRAEQMLPGDRVSPELDDEPVPVWRREQMLAVAGRPQRVRATRWPPDEGALRTGGRSSSG